MWTNRIAQPAVILTFLYQRCSWKIKMYLGKVIKEESNLKPAERLPLILKSFEINPFICCTVSC